MTGPTPPDGFVATALLALARRAGMPVGVASPHLPENLLHGSRPAVR